MPGSRRKPMHIVVMGVSATGKTSVGELLAEELGCEFVEGDSLHPRRNIEKMEAGTPLTDEDRWPWLQAIADLVAVRDHEGTSTVVTCSALKRKYRDILRDAAPTFFVHLDAPFEVLEARMQQRTKHFMPASLLRSQHRKRYDRTHHCQRKPHTYLARYRLHMPCRSGPSQSHDL